MVNSKYENEFEKFFENLRKTALENRMNLANNRFRSLG